jgi:site-specific DNA recombinase
MTKTIRAVPVVRQSRSHDGSASPAEQKKRLAELFAREGWTPACDPIEEIDVSGRTPLAKRRGLLRAVEMVEDGDAEVVAVAYFDRLVRSTKIQLEIAERVEKAGGEVYSGDLGQLTNGTAAKRLSVKLLAALNEHYCDNVAERTAEYKAAAVARGVPPFDRLPPGLQKVYDANGKVLGVEPSDEAPIIEEAFELRAGVETGEPATVEDVRAFLAEHGIERSLHGVTSLLRNRLYIGELSFGKLVNETACTPIVKPGLFQRVQDLRAPRGRKAKSDRLLARLGVLRCATCEARMSVGTQTQGGRQYGFYRCPGFVRGCKARAAISADRVEALVLAEMRARARGKVGRASADAEVNLAEAAAAAAQRQLAKATRVALRSGIADEEATIEELAALKALAAERQAEADRLSRAIAPRTVRRADDLDPSDPEDRDDLRDLIRALVPTVLVSPGRGAPESRLDFGKLAA